MDNEFKVLDEYFRVVNYLSCAMIYLKSNVLLRTPLELDDIKKKTSGATIGGWNIGEPEKTLEEKIEQVKIDMYNDRYKTYEVWSYVLFLCPNLERKYK